MNLNSKEKASEKINQNQVYDVITSKKPDWQEIIYDLINSEQLDPWDIDIVLLTKKYFEKIEEMDDLDFYTSSKVLLSASLLLRIKSEFLLNKHIRSIDEILFGKKEEIKNQIEEIELDYDELPTLIPKTPLSRLRKITLPELMSALNKAINTEARRINREVQIKRARKLSEINIPVFKRTNLKERIKQMHSRIIISLKKPKLEKIAYTDLVGKEREERIASFLPILHLNDGKKLWIEQNKHLEEIWIYLYEYFEENRAELLQDLEQEIDDINKEILLSQEGIEEDNLEKARDKLEERRMLEEEVKKELEDLKIDNKNEIL